jgi:pimeloyl-ACP methyl ester carboxylesterase
MTGGRDFVLSQAPTLLAAREWNAHAGGLPVVMLHGWLDNAGSFEDFAPRLTGRRVIAIDLPGHGRSGHRSPEASYLVPEALWDIERAIASIGSERVVMVSHSLGATITTMYAAAYPHRVERLVAIEGVVPQTEPAEGFVRRLQLHAAARTKAVKPKPVYPSIDAALEARFAVAKHADQEALRPLVTRGLETVPGGYTWIADPRLRQPSAWRLTPEQALNIVDSVRCPVLLFKATEGLPWDADSKLGMAVAKRGWPIETVRGYHHIHLDNPVAVAAAVNKFLSEG